MDTLDYLPVNVPANLSPFSLGLQPSGDDGTRTRDPRLAKAMLSQLSYIPKTSQKGGPDWTRTSDPCVISTVL